MTPIDMENLSISPTQSSPMVEADPKAGLLVLSGESYPVNSFDFFQPVLAWVSNYLERDLGLLTVEIRLTYLNTSSIKCMMDLLDEMEAAHTAGRGVALHWYYDQENDRALDLAEEFKEELTLPFKIIPIGSPA